MKKKILIGVVLVGSVGLLSWFLLRGGDDIEYITEQAVSQQLVQTVSATGTVTTEDVVQLNFAAAGQVSDVLVKVGDAVESGQELASLRQASLEAKIQEASATLALRNAQLRQTIEGVRSEEVSVSGSQVAQAEAEYLNSKLEHSALIDKLEVDTQKAFQDVQHAQSVLNDTESSTELNLSQTRSTLMNSLSQQITKAENAVDLANETLNDLDLGDSFAAGNKSAGIEAEFLLDQLGFDLINAREIIGSAGSTDSLDDSYVVISDLLEKTYKMLDAMLRGLYATPDTYALRNKLDTFKTQTRADLDIIIAAQNEVERNYQAWKSAVNVRTTELNSAKLAMEKAETQLDLLQAQKEQTLSQSTTAVERARTALELAEARENLTTAGARNTDLAIARAQVDQASAGVKALLAQKEDYLIRAPFDGIVTRVSVKEGESLTDIREAAITMISVGEKKIEVDISESDIAKISIGDAAEITLDAYGDNTVFTGSVSHIDPAETLIQDVVYYRVDVTLDEADVSVKKGMTANVDITTAVSNEALSVPQRAVLRDNEGRQYVRLLVDGMPVEATVTTGLLGDRGMIEILSGIEPGDRVIIFERRDE